MNAFINPHSSCWWIWKLDLKTSLTIQRGEIRGGGVREASAVLKLSKLCLYLNPNYWEWRVCTKTECYRNSFSRHLEKPKYNNFSWHQPYCHEKHIYTIISPLEPSKKTSHFNLLSLNRVGFLGVRFEMRIMLVHKYTRICSFRKYTF